MTFALGQVSPSVQAHTLLTGWQHSFPSLVALAIEISVGVCYVAGVARLARRGRQWSAWRTASFLGGVAVVVVALQSGLASYDDSVFVLHIVQHLLLMSVAPVLLAMGAPVTLLLQASGRSVQKRTIAVLHSRPVAVLTHPIVTTALAFGVMGIYLLSSLYPYSLDHPGFHDASHAVFLFVGCLYWWPVVGVDPMRWRLSYPAKLGYLAVGMPFHAFIGVAIMNFGHPIAVAHTLSDTHAGGAVLWAAGELLTVACLMVVGAQWMRHEERQAAREDRRLDAEAARRAASAAGGATTP